MKKIILWLFGIIIIIGIIQFIISPSEFLSDNANNTNSEISNYTEITTTTNKVIENVTINSEETTEDDIYSIIKNNVLNKFKELYGEDADIIGLMHLRTEVENKMYYDGILSRKGYKDKDFTAIINKDDNTLFSLSVGGEIIY